MSRPGPLYTLEERKGGYILVWREQDWSMPRRMVASFPPHPHDPHESAILAKLLVDLLNREFPNRATEGDHDPALDVPPVVIQRKLAAAPTPPAPAPAPPAAPQPVPAASPAPQPMTPLQAYAATRVAKRDRKPMPDLAGLEGRSKVQAMTRSLFGDGDPNAQGDRP